MHMRVSLYELLLFPLVSTVSDVGSLISVCDNTWWWLWIRRNMSWYTCIIKHAGVQLWMKIVYTYLSGIFIENWLKIVYTYLSGIFIQNWLKIVYTYLSGIFIENWLDKLGNSPCPSCHVVILVQLLFQLHRSPNHLWIGRPIMVDKWLRKTKNSALN
jgi:hypothetical protein